MLIQKECECGAILFDEEAQVFDECYYCRIKDEDNDEKEPDAL